MKHKHHIVPKHMGGTDDPSNLVELTIEEHAEAHKNLYEKYGFWQDYLAWKGLSGLLSSDECKFLSIRKGVILGSAVSNGGFIYTNGKESKKFMPNDVPDGWKKKEKIKFRKQGIGTGTKNRKWYHNPETDERKCFLENEYVPNGWVLGQGKKKKVRCFWYTNGIKEGQFEINKGPRGWERGRLKGIYGGLRVNKN